MSHDSSNLISMRIHNEEIQSPVYAAHNIMQMSYDT
jgi:hypothetical protein